MKPCSEQGTKLSAEARQVPIRNEAVTVGTQSDDSVSLTGWCTVSPKDGEAWSLQTWEGQTKLLRLSEAEWQLKINGTQPIRMKLLHEVK